MYSEKLYIKTPKALLILTVLRKRVVLSSRLNVSFRNAACKTCNECECRYTKSNNNSLFQLTPALELTELCRVSDYIIPIHSLGNARVIESRLRE